MINNVLTIPGSKIIKSPMKINVELLENGRLPEYAHGEEDAGFDLYSAGAYDIMPGETKLVQTNIKVEIPIGFVMHVCSRSGLALKHGVFVLNAPGIVDPGYRGTVGVILHNAGNKEFNIIIGDRVAQGVIVKTEHVQFVESTLSDTKRGEGGFGSTGVNGNDKR